MSMSLRRSALCLAGVVTIGVGGAAGVNYVHTKYPPSGNFYHFGAGITIGKTTKYVIGHFGADKSVFDRGLDKSKGLYYGDKAEAQRYADSRAKFGKGQPQVAVIVANRLPTVGDHSMPEFEHGPRALSEKFLVEEEVEILEVENVDTQTRIGLIPGIKRLAIHHLEDKVYKP